MGSRYPNVTPFNLTKNLTIQIMETKSVITTQNEHKVGLKGLKPNHLIHSNTWG